MQKILTFLSSQAGKGVLRHVLTIVGTFLVTKSVLNQTALDTLLAQSEVIFGAIGTLITAGVTVWSVKSKKDQEPPTSIPGV